MSEPPRPKPRLCTICKKPRAGHPRTGCDNAIVIPITQPMTSTTGAAIQLQTIPAASITAPAHQYQQANPQPLSMAGGSHPQMYRRAPALYHRASSVKMTPAQLYEEELHALNYLNSGEVWPHDPAVIPEELHDAQWPSNDQWQLILTGHRSPQGHWVVTTRDIGNRPLQPTPQRVPVAGPSVQANPPAPTPAPELPANSPAPAPAPSGQLPASASAVAKVDAIFKFLFSILLGAALGLYGVTRF